MRAAASGVTLIEVLVTLLLVGVIVSAVLGSMSSTFAMNSEAEQRIDGVLLAQSEMDEVKRLEPSSLPASGSTTETVSIKGRSYVVTLRYCTTPAYCQNGNRHIAIEVKYGGDVMFAGESVFTQVRVDQ